MYTHSMEQNKIQNSYHFTRNSNNSDVSLLRDTEKNSSAELSDTTSIRLKIQFQPNSTHLNNLDEQDRSERLEHSSSQ